MYSMKCARDIQNQNAYQLVDISMCTKQDGFHMKSCRRRTCHECGTEKLDDHVKAVIDVSGNQTVTWQNWTTTKIPRPGNTPSTRKVCVTKEGTLLELIELLKAEVEELGEHLFLAAWQKIQFQGLTKTPPINSVVMHLDFSFYQNEISSAHWMKNLVTVHPIVAFYNCRECGESAKPVMDVLVFLSDDNIHDHHSVQEFVKQSVKFLKEDRDVEFNQLYEFTDGCSSQYKSRGPFVDISYGLEDFGFRRERNYFCSCHGKGPSDGAGGVTKTMAKLGVVRGDTIIINAITMFRYLKNKGTRSAKIQSICNHSRREFFLVTNINRNRPEREIATTLKGTRKIYSVRSISPGVVCTRDLTCTCNGCYNERDCENKNHAGPWSVKRLNLKIPQVMRNWQSERGVARGRGVRTRGGGGKTRGQGVKTRGQGVRTRGNAHRGRGVRTRGGSTRAQGMRSIGNRASLTMEQVSDDSSDDSLSEDDKDKCEKSSDATSSCVSAKDEWEKRSNGNTSESDKDDRDKNSYVSDSDDELSDVWPTVTKTESPKDVQAATMPSVVFENTVDLSEVESLDISGTSNIFNISSDSESMNSAFIQNLLELISVANEEILISNDAATNLHKEITNGHNSTTEPSSVEPTASGKVLSVEQASIEPALVQPLSPEAAAVEPASLVPIYVEPTFLESSALDLVEHVTLKPTLPEPESLVVAASVEPASVAPSSLEPAIQENNMVMEPALGEVTVKPTTEEPLEACSQKKKYTVGDYVLVAHGKNKYPAVVTEWPYVKFFTPCRGGLWTEGSVCHTVVEEDIVRVLLVPDIQLRGSRLFYSFKDML